MGAISLAVSHNILSQINSIHTDQKKEHGKYTYSRTSLARTPSGSWKYVRDRGT